MYDTVLRFWFQETDARQWFSSDAAFDALVRERFEPLLQQAADGALASWRSTAQGRLAEIIVLDQFSRNIYRDTPQAFAQDAMAVQLAQAAVAQGALEVLTEVERNFLLMPFMHSESRAVHLLAEPLFKTYASANTYQFELKHKVIIDRFGRYPHRNEVLGRSSTPEEIEFLQQPGSGF